MNINLARVLRDLGTALHALRRDVAALRPPPGGAMRKRDARTAGKAKGGRPRKVPLSDARWVKARRLWETKGWGAMRIEAATGLRHNGVTRQAAAEKWTRPAGAEPRRIAHPAAAWVAPARKAWERGAKVAAIAAKAGVSEVRIYQVAKRDDWARLKGKASKAATPSSPSSGDAARAEAPRRSPKRRPRPEPSNAAAPSGSAALPSGVGASVGNQNAASTIADPRRACSHAPRHRVAFEPAHAMAFRRAWNAGRPRAELAVTFDLPDDESVIGQADYLGLAARAGETFPTGQGQVLISRREVMDRLQAAAPRADGPPQVAEASP